MNREGISVSLANCESLMEMASIMMKFYDQEIPINRLHITDKNIDIIKKEFQPFYKNNRAYVVGNNINNNEVNYWVKIIKETRSLESDLLGQAAINLITVTTIILQVKYVEKLLSGYDLDIRDLVR